MTELSQIAQWLNKMNVDFYQDEDDFTIHLSYLQKIDGIYEAKIELIDDILKVVITAQIKLSAIISLMAELSQINQSIYFTKIYLDIVDDSEPKIIFTYAIHAADDLTFNQFSLSLASVEEEALQVIGELNSCELLNNKCRDTHQSIVPLVFH
ncbi:putative sensory transduction regulator [Orbus hercynius]|uniref:Putative sensory transduction regulator n=1 Tax=Orbus hercynius TaxID=593135 RepID=A0A495RJS5_9GAMM|nr:YbjN domain-containing protein [Orbus hercynius]RKS87695.1 putative sensory transduction regulator [Orbus hercynius]